MPCCVCIVLVLWCNIGILDIWASVLTISSMKRSPTVPSPDPGVDVATLSKCHSATSPHFSISTFIISNVAPDWTVVPCIPWHVHIISTHFSCLICLHSMLTRNMKIWCSDLIFLSLNTSLFKHFIWNDILCTVSYSFQFYYFIYYVTGRWENVLIVVLIVFEIKKYDHLQTFISTYYPPSLKQVSCVCTHKDYIDITRHSTLHSALLL